MTILVVLLILAAAGLTVYAFLPSRPKEDETQAVEAVNPLKDMISTNFQAQVNALSSETERLKAENAAFNSQVEKLKAISVSVEPQLNKLAEENKKLKEEAAAKLIEIDKLSQQKIGLEVEVKNQKQKIDSMEKNALSLQDEAKQAEVEKMARENLDLTNKVKMLEIQLQEYNKEIEKQKSITDEKEAASREALEDIIADLNKKLSDKTREAEILGKEKTDISSRIQLLETEIERYKQEMAKAAQIPVSIKEEIKVVPGQEGSVSQEEYEQLKKKLEQAEEVLRIVHGAGG